MKIVIYLRFTLLASNIYAKTENQQDIEQVLSEFSESISNKKRENFLNLFYSNKVLWLAVVDDKDLEDFDEKVNLYNKNGFIDWVVSDKDPKEVRFSNIIINSNGDVASVYCDYAFYLNHEITNYGKETFTLVRTKDGWKISAIAFSSKLAESP